MARTARTEVLIRDEQDLLVDVSAIEQAAALVLLCELGENAEECEVSIVLVDEPTIHGMNRAHRGVDRPTDVLSYSQTEPFAVHRGDLLGDVVLCPAVAVRRAQEEGRSPNREVLELVVHGVLHLIGYDDRSDAGRQAMLARQALILQQMGA